MPIPIFPKDVYSAVTQDRLLTLLGHYRLGAVARIVPLGGGLRNASFLVKAGQEKYVLRLYQPEASRDRQILEMIKLQLYLHDRGFPVPRIVFTADELYFFYEEVLDCRRRIALFEFLEGWTLPYYLPRHLFAAGRTLANLHTVLADYPGKNCLPFHGDAAAGPTTVLHGDFARANLLFNHEGVCGILDFESAAGGPALLDISRSLDLFFRDQPGMPPEEIRKHFLDGYAAGGFGGGSFVGRTLEMALLQPREGLSPSVP